MSDQSTGLSPDELHPDQKRHGATVAVVAALAVVGLLVVLVLTRGDDAGRGGGAEPTATDLAEEEPDATGRQTADPGTTEEGSAGDPDRTEAEATDDTAGTEAPDATEGPDSTDQPGDEPLPASDGAVRVETDSFSFEVPAEWEPNITGAPDIGYAGDVGFEQRFSGTFVDATGGLPDPPEVELDRLATDCEERGRDRIEVGGLEVTRDRFSGCETVTGTFHAYAVTDPDGATIIVSGPEQATVEQAVASLAFD